MNWNWLFLSINWYLYLFFIGMIFFPLTKKIFNKFSLDFGYPFAKTLAIIFISYTAYVLGIIKILKFTQNNLFLIIIGFIFINLLFFSRNFLKDFKKNKNLKFIIFEECLFLISFLFWAFVRAHEPSIRSLEKFMDFGFINSILRADYFPPKDMWYTPFSINYYYFGHLTGATLIKITNILPSIGYNLILSTIFSLAVSQVFSIVINIINLLSKKTLPFIKLIIYGFIGAFLVNLGGNLHTIYVFTKGYPNDNPIPFWKILSSYNPLSYWYPNATRFIPYTIHEFPSYSYVVADLHGHVFDIPFVLLTISLLFLAITFFFQEKNHRQLIDFKSSIFEITYNQLLITIFLGFLTAVHYMTNAFDGPIYIFLTIIIISIIFKISYQSLILIISLIFSFLIFSFPFSSHFSPFVSGIGVNCSPQFLTNIEKIGPFIFEKGNCQKSPFWMLFVLWGFFWINFILFLFIFLKKRSNKLKTIIQNRINQWILILFSFGTFLIVIPEFFYIKDIYPQHFRANTMFKLGYQAFIMMSITSTIVFYLIKNLIKKDLTLKIILVSIWLFFFFFVFIYPFYAIPSYYGKINNFLNLNLDGSSWIGIDYPQDKEIIDYLNKNIDGQPVILEAQGDSYTDYERISAHTGLPIVAGWWVHEWLWRGGPDFVGQRIPDIEKIYQSKDLKETENLIKKYQIKYIIVSGLEKQKYPELYEEKFLKIGNLIFRSSNGLGAIYQIK